MLSEVTMRTARTIAIAGASLVLALAACSGAARDAVSRRTPPAKGRVVIQAVGDVSLDPAQIPAFRTHGYGFAWSGLHGLFRTDDLTIVNLECPATDVVDPVPKAFSTRCDPEALPAAKAAGVEIVGQANNHAYDQGPAGLLDSLAGLRTAGLEPVGAGSDQRSAMAPVVVRANGWTIAVVGVDEIVDPPEQVAGPDHPGTAVGHRFSLAIRSVRAAERVADLTLVVIHWGTEGERRPSELQVDHAHALIDAGADAIVGSHAHRLQPLEVYRGRPIFYGLGNFVWPRLGAEDARTAVARMTITTDGTIHAELLPASIVADGHPVLRPANP
jgi:poly-gamma-glutamate capsule biosynthesis protein CapA/YwtB (metallophosphatase superfamily)